MKRKGLQMQAFPHLRSLHDRSGPLASPADGDATLGLLLCMTTSDSAPSETRTVPSALAGR
jgi:hypothetical protein